MYLKKAKKLMVSGIFFLVGGCYTQFGSLNHSAPESGSAADTSIVVDSTGDTVKVVNKTDTIIQKEHEICVWERDLLGYPRLNCYKTYYPRNWFIYTNTPWWYRGSAFWDDYGRHHYGRYEPPHHDGGSSGGSGGGPVTKPTVPSVNKNARTSGQRAKEAAPVQAQPQSQSPQGVEKSVVETPPAPQIHQDNTNMGNADTMQIRKRNIRSLRSR